MYIITIMSRIIHILICYYAITCNQGRRNDKKSGGYSARSAPKNLFMYPPLSIVGGTNSINCTPFILLWGVQNCIKSAKL